MGLLLRSGCRTLPLTAIPCVIVTGRSRPALVVGQCSGRWCPKKSPGGSHPGWCCNVAWWLFGQAQFHATVAGAALFRVIGGDRLGLAIAVGDQVVRADAFADQIATDRGCALLRQFLVGGGRTDGVRVAGDLGFDVHLIA